jgi:hypothetical protein
MSNTVSIDKATLAVLNNFAKISDSIHVRKGNVLSTITPLKTIMARATIATEFPEDFALYSLSKFIAILSLHASTTTETLVEFHGSYLRVVTGNTKTRVVYCDPACVTKVPDRVNLPSVDVEFILTTDTLKQVEKALGVLKLEEIVVYGDGNDLYISAEDSGNPTGDTHSVKIGSTERSFKAVFNASNLILMPGSYAVKISRKGLAVFESTDGDLKYYVPVEAESSSFD